MKNITRLTAALALALGLCASMAAANPVSRPLDFATQMTPSFPTPASSGIYAGTLHLVIADDGAVSGWYRAQDSGPPEPVVGGRNGDSIWFDIGNGSTAQGTDGIVRTDGPLQVTGKLDGDRITGTVQDGFSRLVFIAQPEASAQQSE